MLHYFVVCTETGRSIPGHTKGSMITKLFATSGSEEPLKGVCVYFLKSNVSEEINLRNIAEVYVASSDMVRAWLDKFYKKRFSILYTC